MPLKIAADLTAAQMKRLAELPAVSWFTEVEFNNAASPVHPDRSLRENNDYKQAMVADWINRTVKGKRVLDLFSANGAFSILAAQAGAKEVVGVEYDQDRVKAAELLADVTQTNCRFIVGDVYKLTDYFSEPFDVVMCLGGLYHIADPAHVLRQMGELTKEHMILQTSHVMPLPGNWARFHIRRQAGTGKTSITVGRGAWNFTHDCLHNLLEHGGFEVIEERRPPLMKRRRFPWYFALTRPLGSASGNRAIERMATDDWRRPPIRRAGLR